MKRIAVDLDGTLIEDDHWPEMGEWIPGATDALKALASEYDEVVIFTCRAANRELDETTPRNNEDQLEMIENMLLEADIPPNVYVWTLPFKPHADHYVDNRGVRFGGDWRLTLHWLRQLEGAAHVG